MTQSWLFTLIFTFLVLQATVFATSIYMHRGLAHNSLKLHPFVAWLFRLELWLGIGVIPREWVAVHRKHHRYSDEEGDPHSPLREGLWAITLGNYFYYRREIANRSALAEFGTDLAFDGWDKALFKRDKLGILVGMTIFALVLGWAAGPLAWICQGVGYILLSGVVNGICHRIGYKNYNNLATNLPPAGWLIGGEGWHNNHHGHPESPKFSVRAFEFDPSWPVIQILTLLGLASHRPPAVYVKGTSAV